MDDPRFNVISNKDFNNDYDNVMNRIVDHINYPNCEDSGASVADVEDDDVGKNNVDDNNDNDDESDSDGDFF
jgi:hypothetical protein